MLLLLQFDFGQTNHVDKTIHLHLVYEQLPSTEGLQLQVRWFVGVPHPSPIHESFHPQLKLKSLC